MHVERYVTSHSNQSVAISVYYFAIQVILHTHTLAHTHTHNTHTLYKNTHVMYMAVYTPLIHCAHIYVSTCIYIIQSLLPFLGQCPPCPKTMNVSCHCGRSHPMVKRCGVRGWKCGRVCGRELMCGLHTCEQRCHEG